MATDVTPRDEAAHTTPMLSIAVRRHALVSDVGRRLRGECGVPAGSRLVVAISGGADSCALLLACAALAKRRVNGKSFLEVVAAHVHHHLRPEADDEAAFVEQFCAALGIALHVEHVYPAKEKGSKGANARRLRYAALLRVATATSAAFVATAHHAEDQLETLLMALGRGAGVRGLRGMAWTRSLGHRVMLVRPMLLLRKRDCEALCEVAGMSWCDDSSNVDPRSKRSRIRRDVLPILEELWPGAARRSTGTAEVLGTAQQLVMARVADVFGPAETRTWSRAALANMPAALVAEGLRRASEHLHGAPIKSLGQRQLRAATAAIGAPERHPKRFAWPHGINLEVTSKLVTITRAE